MKMKTEKIKGRNINIKKDDMVVVITGKYKAKTGKVLRALPQKNKVVVEGVNIITKHTKPSMTNTRGGMIKKEAPIFRDKVMLYCQTCKKGVKIEHQLLEDGKKVRVCKHCKEQFDK